LAYPVFVLGVGRVKSIGLAGRAVQLVPEQARFLREGTVNPAPPQL
jgi:hypothetical protein